MDNAQCLRSRDRGLLAGTGGGSRGHRRLGSRVEHLVVRPVMFWRPATLPLQRSFRGPRRRCPAFFAPMQPTTRTEIRTTIRQPRWRIATPRLEVRAGGYLTPVLSWLLSAVAEPRASREGNALAATKNGSLQFGVLQQLDVGNVG